MLIKKDENAPVTKAIIESRHEEKDQEIISLLLNGLEKIKVNIKSVIEHGCGVNAAPAAAFVKNNVSYHCVDMNSEMLYYFRENLGRYAGETRKNVNVHEVDISKIKLKQVFVDIERPLMVLFYHSFEYLLSYATSTHLAKKIAEKECQGRKYATTIEQLGMDASEREKSRELILPVIVKKYTNFMKVGDVMVCISGTEPNMVYPYIAHTGAEIFYNIAKKFKWSTIILLTASYKLALEDATTAYAETFKRGVRGDDVLIQNRAARIREIKNKNGAILGVICIK